MDTLHLKDPVKPAIINQGFGNDPAYYARFKDQFGNPEKGHMGIDFRAAHGTPVYASCDGQAYFGRDEHGGEGIYIRTGLLDYNGQPAHFNVIHWHLCGDTDPHYASPIPLDGNMYPVETGDLIGYADNTGAPYESTGDHLHFGLLPLDQYNTIIDQKNGFNGCIDPMPYFDGSAQDVPRDTSYIASLLKAAWQLLAAKFPGRVAPPSPSL
jgi:murein DD-endopeptidase MepM/ murein hydrolase activator NlpD